MSCNATNRTCTESMRSQPIRKRGRITFWCPVDIQDTLQRCDKKEIRAKAREMLDKLWQGRGGLIAGYYADNASIGLDPRWQGCACDAFSRCGVRSRYAGRVHEPRFFYPHPEGEGDAGNGNL